MKGKKIKVVLHLLFSLVIFTVQAQNSIESIRRNTIFLEVLGNGGYYSLNYDRILSNRESWKLAGRVGLSYFNHFDQYRFQYAATPFELSFLKGHNKHFLEVGLGLTPFYVTGERLEREWGKRKELNIVSTARLGYRYQKKEGGIFYKVGWTPGYVKVYSLGKETIPSPFPSPRSYTTPYSFGLAIGYTIK